MARSFGASGSGPIAVFLFILLLALVIAFFVLAGNDASSSGPLEESEALTVPTAWGVHRHREPGTEPIRPDRGEGALEALPRDADEGATPPDPLEVESMDRVAKTRSLTFFIRGSRTQGRVAAARRNAHSFWKAIEATGTRPHFSLETVRGLRYGEFEDGPSREDLTEEIPSVSLLNGFDGLPLATAVEFVGRRTTVEFQSKIYRRYRVARVRTLFDFRIPNITEMLRKDLQIDALWRGVRERIGAFVVDRPLVLTSPGWDPDADDVFHFDLQVDTIAFKGIRTWKATVLDAAGAEVSVLLSGELHRGDARTPRGEPYEDMGAYEFRFQILNRRNYAPPFTVTLEIEDLFGARKKGQVKLGPP